MGFFIDIENKMEAGKRTIREVFNRGRNLEIPFFQRNYVWDEKEWERFLDDMIHISATKRPYFLGSVILKQQPTPSNSDEKRTVIDGQQRLTTLNIFFKVLCLKEDSLSDFQQVFKKQKKPHENILIHNRHDLASFNKILNLESLDEIPVIDQITKAYNFFKSKIDSTLQQDLDIYDLLDNIVFVGIDLSYDDNEQLIFDTINSLGVRLTTAELLKNYLFNSETIQDYVDYWQPIFEKDKDTIEYWDTELHTNKRTFSDIFLFSYLQIKSNQTNLSISTFDKSDFFKVEDLFQSYKTYNDKYLKNTLQSKESLEEIKAYAEIFKKNFNYESLNDTTPSESSISRIQTIIFALDTTTLIPYILFILKNVTDITDQNELFGIIESYLIRRIITKESTKTYSKLFIELIEKNILNTSSFITHMKKVDSTHKFPNDEDLLQGFKNSSLINKQALGIIYLLETAQHSSKSSTALLNIKEYTLEHLMPKKWETNWGAAQNYDIRNQVILNLGNLAILTHSLNSSIKNANWDIKKVGNKKSKGLNEYAQGLKTLTPYLALTSWDEEAINQRADDLYNLALQTWQSI